MTPPEDYIDPIIEEVRRVREELSLRFPDMKSFGDYIRQQERLRPWPAGRVSFEPRRKASRPAPSQDAPSSDS
ncbi:MAG TPA: hypothetical protein VGM84_14685 [Steroidobacteraceae bacterium]|jgi:hypothetical protein